MEASKNKKEQEMASDQTKASSWISPLSGLGIRFDTKYNEQTGLLDAFNVGVERFQPGSGYEKYYTRSDAIPKPDDESGWDGQQDSTLHIHEKEAPDVRTWPPGTLVHVVFHFHDNYCDSSSAFLDRKQAEHYFQECEEEQWDKIEAWRKNTSGFAFCIVKSDRWHCDVLECELTGRSFDGWTRPDKGDTWWLRSVVLD